MPSCAVAVWINPSFNVRQSRVMLLSNVPTSSPKNSGLYKTPITFSQDFVIAQQCSYTGWAKKVIPLVHILHCTRGITFLAHPVYSAFQKNNPFNLLITLVNVWTKLLWQSVNSPKVRWMSSKAVGTRNDNKFGIELTEMSNKILGQSQRVNNTAGGIRVGPTLGACLAYYRTTAAHSTEGIWHFTAEFRPQPT